MAKPRRPADRDLRGNDGTAGNAEVFSCPAWVVLLFKDLMALSMTLYMIPSSRLGCPLSLKAANMGNPGLHHMNAKNSAVITPVVLTCSNLSR